MKKRDMTLFTAPLAAGAAAAVLFMLFYAVHGYYPFGERSVAWCDMDQQYVPLLMELKAAFSGGSLFLGRGGGMMNFYGVFLFFLSSPLSLISLAVDNSRMIWFVNIMLVIKVGLSSASAELYFRKVLPKLNLPVGVLISVMYGLSGYVMLYYQNDMWIDMMIVFPLLMISLFRLIRSGKWGAYAICLAMCVAMNFYISFMVIVFIAMFGGAALYLLCEPEKRGSRALRLVAADLCAALISGGVWLPAFAQYTASGRGNSLSDAFFGGYFADRNFDKIAVLSGTSLVLAGALLIIVFRKSMKSGKALLFGASGLISLAGAFVEPANKLLQTGSYQAYPLRYGFIVLLLIFSACGALLEEAPEKKHRRSACIIVSVLAAVYAAAAFITYTHRSSLSSYAHSLWVHGKDGFIISALALLGAAVCFVCIYSFLRGRTPKWLTVAVMAAVLFSDSFMSFGINVAEASDATGFFKTTCDVLERVPDEGFVRVKELKRYYYPNYAEAMGKYSIGHYTSLTDCDVLYALKRMGYSSHWLDMDSTGGTMLTDELLLNKYVIGEKGRNRFYEPYDLKGGLSLYRDSNVPAGAVISQVSPDELSDFGDYERMEATDFIAERLFGESGTVQKLAPTAVNGVMINAVEGETVVSVVPDEPSELIYEAEIEGCRELYFDLFGCYSTSVEEDYVNSVEVWVNGELRVGSYPTSTVNGIIDLGTYEDETVTVRVRVLKDFTATSFGLYTFDAERAAAAVSSAETASITVDGSTVTATADTSGYVYLPVSWSEGWSCTVNGENASLEKVLGAFCAVKIPKGGGTVQLRFCPKGLKAGSLLTCVGVLLLAVLTAVLRRESGGRLEKAASKAVFGLSAVTVLIFYAAAPLVWAVVNIIYLIGG